MKQKTILYLRTDLYYDDLVAGGSVGHTIGVVQGFIDNGYDVVCASTCMVKQLEELNVKKNIFIPFFAVSKLLRWHLGSFFQGIIGIFYSQRWIKKFDIYAIYQRYTLLSITGIVLAWWNKKKLILEYNGSEYWISQNWVKKGFLRFPWLIKRIELLNLRKSYVVVVVSELLKEELIRLGICSNKILVNPNGVNLPLLIF